jgi:hypothetical protein
MTGVAEPTASRAPWPVLLAVFSALGMLLSPAAALAQRAPLQGVDWLAVVAGEPGTEAGADCPPGFGGRAPCVLVHLGGDQMVGYPLVDNVLYGDLDADGLDEAVIPVDSRGTAGTIGFLVYHEAAPRPRLVASQAGYKLGLSIVDRQLVVDQPYYFGGDPNCCPTALNRTPFRLVGGALVGGAETWLQPDRAADRPLSVAEVVVLGFYNALRRHAMLDAYAFLTPRFQAANPFDGWASGYATTEEIDVETRAGASPNEAGVSLETVDRLPDQTRRQRHWTGTWRLAPNPAAPLGLLLDQATITQNP